MNDELIDLIIEAHVKTWRRMRELFPSMAYHVMPAITFECVNKNNIAECFDEENNIAYNVACASVDIGRYISDIIPHEMAHQVVYNLGIKEYHHHGTHWQYVCTVYGITPKRLYLGFH